MRDIKTTLYTNSYLVFLKLMSHKMKTEVLSESIKNAFSAIGVPTEDYFQMGSSVIGYLFQKNAKLCYTFLKEEIKKIYLDGKRKILARAAGNMIFLEEVEYKGFYYSFLVDHHSSKNVVILLDYYRFEDKKKEDILFTSRNGVSFLANHPPLHYRIISEGRYHVINTYNAFCAFANMLNVEPELTLNVAFFEDFLKENEDKLQWNPSGKAEEHLTGNKFYYVRFANIIIIFDYDY